MSILPILLAGAGLVAVAAAGSAAVGSSKTAGPSTPDRKRLRAMGATLELALSWPRLADFLDAAAYTESRWHPNAGASKVGTNGAIGAYQIRPESAFPHKQFQWQLESDPRVLEAAGTLLLDPRINTAAIVDYFRRVFPYDGAENATWAELRASMAFPHYVGGREFAKDKERFDDAIERFEKALGVVGLPQSFASLPAFPPGWGGSWRQNGGGVNPLIPLLGGKAIPA